MSTKCISTTTIEFFLQTDIATALDDVRDAVTRVRADLPQDIQEPIISKKVNIGGSLMTYAVSSDKRQTDELSWFVDREGQQGHVWRQRRRIGIAIRRY